MTKDQREKIAETIGALYMASANATDGGLKTILARYADDLAGLLDDDNKPVNLGNGFGLTINAEDIARGRLSETKEYDGYVGSGEGHGGENEQGKPNSEIKEYVGYVGSGEGHG